ncbi:MAG: hypothetical protein L0K68_09885 [Tetragenococcus koreensis]|nr:hypothetical protein [Tetragenococcus koreensis]
MTTTTVSELPRENLSETTVITDRKLMYPCHYRDKKERRKFEVKLKIT